MRVTQILYVWLLPQRPKKCRMDLLSTCRHLTVYYVYDAVEGTTPSVEIVEQSDTSTCMHRNIQLYCPFGGYESIDWGDVTDVGHSAIDVRSLHRTSLPRIHMPHTTLSMIALGCLAELAPQEGIILRYGGERCAVSPPNRGYLRAAEDRFTFARMKAANVFNVTFFARTGTHRTPRRRALRDTSLWDTSFSYIIFPA